MTLDIVNGVHPVIASKTETAKIRATRLTLDSDIMSLTHLCHSLTHSLTSLTYTYTYSYTYKLRHSLTQSFASDLSLMHTFRSSHDSYATAWQSGIKPLSLHDQSTDLLLLS